MDKRKHHDPANSNHACALEIVFIAPVRVILSQPKTKGMHQGKEPNHA
jgi:hypothetical protein